MNEMTKWDAIKLLKDEIKEIYQKERELLEEATMAQAEGNSLRWQELCVAIVEWRTLEATKRKELDDAYTWLRQRNLPTVDPVDELNARIADYPRRQRLYDLLATREELMNQLRIIHKELYSLDRMWNHPTVLSAWRKNAQLDNIKKLKDDLKLLEAERDKRPDSHVIDPQLLKTNSLTIDPGEKFNLLFKKHYRR